MNRVFAWPVGQESSSSNRNAQWVYLGGSALGGLFLGLVFAWIVGILAAIPQGARTVAALAVILPAFYSEFRGDMKGWPQRRRQVPREWLLLGDKLAALRFGLALGFGLLTYLHHALFYGVAALLVANGSMVVAVCVGFSFGVARGLQPLVVGQLNSTLKRAARLESLLHGRTFDGFARAFLFAFVAYGGWDIVSRSLP